MSIYSQHEHLSSTKNRISLEKLTYCREEGLEGAKCLLGFFLMILGLYNDMGVEPIFLY